MSNNSPAYELLAHVWEHTRGGSWLVLNQSMHSAMMLAISAGMKFDKNDFSKFRSDFRLGYWLGEDPERNVYADACRVKSTSACIAWENYRKRKPFFLGAGNRLHVGSHMPWELIQDGPPTTIPKISRPRVTSIDSDGEGLIACSTEWVEEKRTTVVRRRIHLTRDEIAELDRAEREKARKERDDKMVECRVCHKRHRRGDGECPCTRELADCECGKRRWRNRCCGIRCKSCNTKPGYTRSDARP